jgi:3-deoxy-D-manno-octulosonate 8-phosphate phosphatase (KDO 8-P phosphatase)
MGVELLGNEGIGTAIISGERSANIEHRSKKLRLPHLYLGVEDKHAALEKILADTSLKLHQLSYIGDDVNDFEIIRAIRAEGLTAAPADAVSTIADAVHYCCTADGGHGAFREFADWLLLHRVVQGRNDASGTSVLTLHPQYHRVPND